MANVKISNFTPQTNVILLDGFAAYEGTVNKKISGNDLVNSLETNLDLTDFTTITGGAAGEVLTVNGTGTGLTWSTVSVATPGIADVLTANDTTNAGQEILFTGDGVVQTGTVRYDARGILDNTSGGSFLIARATFGDLDITASSGNLTLTSNGVGNKINFNGDAKLVSDLYDGSNSAGTAGQVLSSLGTGNGTEWITPASGGGDSVQTLTGSGATVEWDFTLGNNAIWEPVNTGAGNPVQILAESSTPSKQFPDGARGCLKIIPTNTVNFQLFSNSKLPSNEASINAQLSASNPTILYYFYDGTNFNWFYDVNMVDPIYTGNPAAGGADPSVDTANLIGFWWPGSISNLTSGQAVQTGQAWDLDPGVSNTLIGDLSCQRSTTSNTNVSMRWYARDNANQIAPYWESNPDQNGTRAAFEKLSIASTNIGDFSVALTFQVNSNTQTGTSFSDYVGMFDLDKDDDAAVYLVDRRLADYTGGTTYLGNFPRLITANATGNPNNINFEDQWIFVHLSYNFGGNIVQGYIGCQSTYDNAGTTGNIKGFDGTDLSIDSSGLYGFVTSVSSLSEGAINDVVVWGASSSTNTYSWEGGKQGLCAVWNTAFIPVATIISNWDNIRNSYYIT